jgi:hypothetical protein
VGSLQQVADTTQSAATELKSVAVELRNIVNPLAAALSKTTLTTAPESADTSAGSNLEAQVVSLVRTLDQQLATLIKPETPVVDEPLSITVA